MGELILITGGARSGKSTFAERLAKHYEQRQGRRVVYVATAQIFDEEMAERVKHHRRRRPPTWEVIEAPYDIEAVFERYNGQRDLILLDCVTLWLSNLLLKAWDEFAAKADGADPVATRQTFAAGEMEAAVLTRVQNLATLAAASEAVAILVTNEVGLGVVPDTPLGRIYRDLSGKANQVLGSAADKAYLVVAGYPLDIKKAAQFVLAELGIAENSMR